MTLSTSSSTNNSQHIVLYIGHAYDLVFFLRLIPLVRDSGNYIFSAVVAIDAHLVKITRLDYFLNQITNDHILISESEVPRLNMSVPDMSLKIKAALGRLNNLVCAADLFIALDKSQMLPHILLSKFRRSILVQTFEPNDLLDDYQIAWKSTLLANIYHFLFGAKWKIIRANKKSSLVSHHEVIGQNAEIIYRNGDKSLPNRLILPPLVCHKRPGKKILIFGSRFLSWDYFTEEMRIDLLNFYRAISTTFKKYSFIYKPHPYEMQQEFKLIQGCFAPSQIKNIGYDLNSELVLLSNHDIEYCFSLGSTSSMSAFEMGFKSFVIYKLLGFPKEIERTYDSIFPNVPKEFFLRDDYDLRNLPTLMPAPGYLDYFLSSISIKK